MQDTRDFVSGGAVVFGKLGFDDGLPLEADGLKLEMLSNRGMAVWPKGLAETFCVDVFRCRFKLPDGASGAAPHDKIVALLDRVHRAGLEFVKMELLYNFDGQPGFSRGQGQ